MRLKEETEYCPKPLIKIGSMPILWHIMKIYSFYGIKEFILCLGYKGEMIKEYFLNFEKMVHNFTMDLRSSDSVVNYHNGNDLEDWKITFVNTGQEANTGSRVAQIKSYVEGETFCLTYGDGLANINISDLIRFHKNKEKILTLTGVHPNSVFGILEQEDGLVKTFREKKRMESMINGGFFVCEPGIFDFISCNQDCVFETDPLQQLVQEAQLAVYDHQGYWDCMDTYKHYENLNQRWRDGDAPWKIWNQENQSFCV